MTVRELDAETWPAFCRLVEKHNGVWGGCWCLAFHQKVTGSKETNQAVKHQLVCHGKARAALVFVGDDAVGWCQFGRPSDLPRIYHRKEYERQRVAAADWRVTCFFVDRHYRRRGIARIALDGALDFIAREGGGLVESFPNEVGDKKTSASFLHNVTLTLFEATGFERVAKIGMHKWLVVKHVEPAR
jgi:GNAT superfamily N-acetyltransferase